MTENQLIDAITLQIQIAVGLPVPPATYANYIAWDDVSDYAALLSPGQSVATVMKVLSPVGIGVYENPGYASDDFSDPDYNNNNPNSAQLPLTVSSQPVQGVYSFLIKAQFDDGIGGGFTVQKTIVTIPLCLDDRPTAALSETYSCSAGTYTSTDVTPYGNANLTLFSIVREHIVYPPSVSGQTPTTADAAVNEVGDLWTGTYEASLASTVTYIRGNTSFIFYITTRTELLVVCDSALCVLYCCLQTVRNKYYTFASRQGLNSTEVQSLQLKFQLGVAEYFMAVRAQLCGQNVDTHVVKFYQVTGCDPNCDGCSNQPAPVIPDTTTLQGADGTDGLTAQFQMSGTVFQWKYTTDVSWTDLIDFATLNLTPDFFGYNYWLYLADVTPVSTSAVSTLQTLKTNTTNFTTTDVTVGASGDYLKIHAEFAFTANKATVGKTVYVNFGAVQTGWYQDSTVGIFFPTITIDLIIRRTGNATQFIEVSMVRNGEIINYQTTGSETWAGNITTTVKAEIGDATAAVDEVTVNAFSIEIIKQVSPP